MEKKTLTHRDIARIRELTEQLRARGCPADCVHRELR